MTEARLFEILTNLNFAVNKGSASDNIWVILQLLLMMCLQMRISISILISLLLIDKITVNQIIMYRLLEIKHTREMNMSMNGSTVDFNPK